MSGACCLCHEQLGCCRWMPVDAIADTLIAAAAAAAASCCCCSYQRHQGQQEAGHSCCGCVSGYLM